MFPSFRAILNIRYIKLHIEDDDIGKREKDKYNKQAIWNGKNLVNLSTHLPFLDGKEGLLF